MTLQERFIEASNLARFKQNVPPEFYITEMLSFWHAIQEEIWTEMSKHAATVARESNTTP